MIIALGEAFVSIGIGVRGLSLGTGVVAAAILGLLIATSFWLAYFDFFSIRVEGILRDRQGAERVALARDLYVFAHFPMIVGIVLFAFAMKTIVGHIDEQLDWVTSFALCGGCALYLLTYSAIRIRFERRVVVSPGRFVAATALLPRPSARDGRAVPGRPGDRHCRVGAAPCVRARLVASGSRGDAFADRVVRSLARLTTVSARLGSATAARPDLPRIGAFPHVRPRPRWGTRPLDQGAAIPPKGHNVRRIGECLDMSSA